MMKITKQLLKEMIEEECSKLLAEQESKDSGAGDPAAMAALDKEAEQERRKGLSKMSQGPDIRPQIKKFLNKALFNYKVIKRNRDRIPPANRVNADAIFYLIKAIEIMNNRGR